MDAQHRLATYGSLAPGRPNHHHVAAIRGRWLSGAIHGRLVEAGWGASMGFPGLDLAPEARAVEVQILESADLPGHWPRLDEFEGAEYERVTTDAHTAEGDLAVSVYVLREVPR